MEVAFYVIRIACEKVCRVWNENYLPEGKRQVWQLGAAGPWMTSWYPLPLFPAVPFPHRALTLLPDFPPTCFSSVPTGGRLGHQTKLCGLAMGSWRPQLRERQGVSWLQGSEGDGMLGRLFYPWLLDLRRMFSLSHFWINKKPDGPSLLVRIVC